MKVSIVSLGCSKNLVDSEVISGIIVKEGYEITDSLEDAEIIIINTCSFIEEAKKESIENILQLAEFKKYGICKKLIVVGCLPQRYPKELLTELKEADIFIGTGEFYRIGEILKENSNKEDRRIYINDPQFIYDHETPRIGLTEPYTAYVKISEGCENFCSYCVIPKIRGRLRSRPLESVVKEVKSLVSNGVKEINIIGQDITSYGKDIGIDLKLLLNRLVKIKDIKWIRLLYTHPAHIDEELINIIKNEGKICKYIDVPIQHINNRILEMMNRKINREYIEDLIFKIRDKIPDITLRTSIIVGFPGESGEEFNELLEFIKYMKFERLGAFIYSREEGTLASKLPYHIPERVKKNRYKRLMETQAQISFEKNREKIGMKEEAIIEGYKDSILIGRASSQAPEVDGVTYITKGWGEIGELVNIIFRDADYYDLYGEIY